MEVIKKKDTDIFIYKTGKPVQFVNLTYGLAHNKFSLIDEPYKIYIYTGCGNVNNMARHILESESENLLVDTNELSTLFKLEKPFTL